MKKIITLSLIILSFSLASSSLAIGIISKPIDIQDAIRGETIQETLQIFNSEDGEALYQLLAEGDIKDWVTFYQVNDLENPITQVVIPQRGYYDLTVFIKTPDDIPNGEYEGQLTIVLTPDTADGDGSRVTVSQKVSREVFIEVSDNEIIKLAVSVIPQDYNIKKGENLNVRFIFDNQGNVSLKPDIQFKIMQGKKVVLNTIYPYPDNELAVKPLAQYEIPSLEILTSNLDKGKYVAVVDFLHNGKSVLTEDFAFSVGGQGSILGAAISRVQINWWIFALALLIIAVALVFTFSRKKIAKKGDNI